MRRVAIIVSTILMAATLGFEHHVLDFRSTFRQHVMDNFVREYACGRTPNPCVMCNSHIKWGELIKAAEEYNCDYIATGHYAQIAEYRGHYYLKNAVDTHKDQTYFLWMLTEENLRRTIFPLGGLTKAEVREIALNHGFEKLSKKAESQEKSPAIKGQLTIVNGQLQIDFAEPVWGVAPGQSLVIYKDGLLVGGGIIEEG